MAINVSQAFHRTAALPIDDSQALTKAEMLTVNDNLMPSKYFTVCQDDGFFYMYDKSNTVDPETGKFRKFEGGGGADALADLSDVTLSSLASGDALAYNGTKWENTALSDVATSGESADVTYDNTTSGLLAANVKAALDELADEKADSATTVAGYGITDAYTKSEVDNMLSTIETNIDWKEAVATYADIATTYPNPQDGWTVNVKDTDYTYRYNGSAWVAISANAIPEATTSVNGLMTTTQVSKLDGIESGAEANVQVDWSQTTTTADDYIKNKPTLGTAAAKDSTNAVTQGSTDLLESGAAYTELSKKAAKSTIINATLAASATSVTFTGIPTSGDHLIDFFTSTGINYTAIDYSTPGEVTLTYEAQASAVTVTCEIKEG